MIRFQADADLDARIVRATCRLEAAIDFQTAADADLAGQSDAQVLALAADGRRILVTHDQRTMPRHFGSLIQQRSSPGVIIAPQHAPCAAVAEELVLILTATTADEWGESDRVGEALV